MKTNRFVSSRTFLEVKPHLNPFNEWKLEPPAACRAQDLQQEPVFIHIMSIKHNQQKKSCSMLQLNVHHPMETKSAGFVLSDGTR